MDDGAEVAELRRQAEGLRRLALDDAGVGWRWRALEAEAERDRLRAEVLAIGARLAALRERMARRFG